MHFLRAARPNTVSFLSLYMRSSQSFLYSAKDTSQPLQSVHTEPSQNPLYSSLQHPTDHSASENKQHMVPVCQPNPLNTSGIYIPKNSVLRLKEILFYCPAPSPYNLSQLPQETLLGVPLSEDTHSSPPSSQFRPCILKSRVHSGSTVLLFRRLICPCGAISSCTRLNILLLQ